ncbi:MAG: NUDIX domain-containing protein [Pseudomonadota bacterium]
MRTAQVRHRARPQEPPPDRGGRGAGGLTPPVRIVNGILLRRDRVLVCLRSEQRPAYPGYWSMPGGHVEPGESLIAALHRELQEELGIAVTDAGAPVTIDDPTRPTQYTLFAVRAWRGTPELLGDEHSQMMWVSIEEARALQPFAVPEVLDHIEAWLG